VAKTQAPRSELLDRRSNVICGWTEVIDVAAAKHFSFLIAFVLPLTMWKYHIWHLSG